MLKNLQCLRGVAAVLVVGSHIGHWNALSTNQPYDKTIAALGTYGVYIFFVISGFIITFSHKKEIGQPAKINGYLIKRAFRIYPAYLAFGFVNVLSSKLAVPTWDETGNLTRNLPEMVAALTLIPIAASNPYCSLLGVGWTLFFEMVFYLVFIAFFWGMRVGLTVIGIFSLLCLFNRSVMEIDCFWLARASVLFSGGCFLGLMLRSGLISRRISTVICVTGLTLFVGAIHFHGVRVKAAEVLIAAAAIFLVAGAVGLDFSDKERIPGLFKRCAIVLGTISYSLYLCHVPVQSIVQLVLGPPNSSPVICGLFVVAPIGVAYLAYYFIEKPAQILARRLVGAVTDQREKSVAARENSSVA